MGEMAEAIQARSSCRSYSDLPLSGEVQAAIEAVLGSDHIGPFGNRVGLWLLDFGAGGSEGRPTTYGLISGGRYFVAGVAPAGPSSGHDYGYCVERVVLRLTQMGLGTCWLAAFGRKTIAERLGPADGEVTPAVVVVGWPSPQRGFKDRLVSRAVGAAGRKPWAELFRDARTGQPLTPEGADPWLGPLEAVRAAPSAANRQPWRVLRADGPGPELAWHFCSAGRPGVDVGIAMQHFEAVAREQGLDGGWEPSGLRRPDQASGLSYVASWVVRT